MYLLESECYHCTCDDDSIQDVPDIPAVGARMEDEAKVHDLEGVMQGMRVLFNYISAAKLHKNSHGCEIRKEAHWA